MDGLSKCMYASVLFAWWQHRAMCKCQYSICGEDVVICAGGVGNPADLSDLVKHFTFQAILNAYLSVDTFFLLRCVFLFL